MTKTAKTLTDEYTRMLPAAYSQGFAHVRILPMPLPEIEETASNPVIEDEPRDCEKSAL